MALQDSPSTHADPARETLEQIVSARPSESNEKVSTARRTMNGYQQEYAIEALLRQAFGDLGSVIEVKWQEFPTEQNTWELRNQLLEDVPDMVADFDRRPGPKAAEIMGGTQSAQNDRESTMSAPASTNGDVSMATPDSTSTQEQQSNTMSANWKGWAELENDPLIFSTLLREWGVQGVGVREVIPLDTVFDTPVQSTLGLIFLSRYVVFDQGSDEATPSEKLWFANQISSYSCATVALMNIINNRPDVQLGDDLRNFRESTISLSPKDRGLALDNLESVRDVHNSFATENDKLHVDSRLKDDVKAANAKKRAQSRKKGWKGRKKAKMIDDDECGLHFVAFVPAMGLLWRLDGLEREPTSLGRINDAGNWLTMVVPVLEAQFNAAAMNELEFSLLSVMVTNPGAEDEKDQERMRRVREDWGPMMATLVRIHAEKGDLASKLG